MYINLGTKRYLAIILSLILVFIASPIPVSFTVSASSLLSSYQILKADYPEFIQRLKGGGVDEAQIEAFLADLDADVINAGSLTEASFNSKMFSSLRRVIMQEKHEAVLNAVLDSFGSEASYILNSQSLPSSMLPLRNAVKNAVMGNGPTPGTNDSGNSDSGGNSGSSDSSSPANSPSPSAATNPAAILEPLPKAAPVVNSTPPKSNTQEPVDIAGHWAKDNIKKLLAAGASTGYPEGTYKPDNKITRAEFATLLVKAFQLSPASGKVFDDTAGHWARDYISTAAACGIVNGYSNSCFGPDEWITREQMAVMLVKAAGFKQAAGQKSFADDSQVSPWAKEAVAVSAEKQVINGYPDNSFRPFNTASRAEAATVIAKSWEIGIIAK